MTDSQEINIQEIQENIKVSKNRQIELSEEKEKKKAELAELEKLMSKSALFQNAIQLKQEIEKIESQETLIDGLIMEDMMTCKLDDVDTGEGIIKLQKSGAGAVNVLNMKAIPEKFFETKTKKELNKTKLKVAIQDGEEIEGAEVVQKYKLAYTPHGQ